MLAFCGLTWWKKQEYSEETTDLGRLTITPSPYIDSGIKTGPEWGQALVLPLLKELGHMSTV